MPIADIVQKVQNSAAYQAPGRRIARIQARGAKNFTVQDWPGAVPYQVAYDEVSVDALFFTADDLEALRS